MTNGEALFRWREKQGISQDDAGKRMDPPVKQGTWAAWEAGRSPDLHNALQLDKLTDGDVSAGNWPRAAKTKRRVVKRKQQPAA